MDNLRPNPNKKLANYIKHFLMQISPLCCAPKHPQDRTVSWLPLHLLHGTLD